MSIINNSYDNLNDIQQIIIPRTNDIGGFEVYRALPSSKQRLVGPFIFFDQMGPGEFLTNEGLDVRPHPHINLATVTYLFDGKIDHKDSLGTDQTIEPGAVNLMTAGSGITHSERSGNEERAKKSNLFGIQSWIALPEKHEEIDPTFDHIAKADLPIINEDNLKMRLIMGELYGLKSPTPTYQDTLYADFELNKGAVTSIPNVYEEMAIYVLTGQIQIGDTVYDPQQLLVLNPKIEMKITALEDTRMVLIGGETMDSERYIWWNFVSSSKDRIEQAKADWKEGRFAKVPNDNKEFIPLPEK